MRNPWRRVRRWWFRRQVETPAEELARALKRYAAANGMSAQEAAQHLARLNPVRGKSRHLPLSRRERRAKARSGGA